MNSGHLKLPFLVIILVFFTCLGLKAQVNVSAGHTGQELAQKLAGKGVTIQNAVLDCSPKANGVFSVVTSDLGIDSGIVLTTGRAATDNNGIGVNGFENNLASTNNHTSGDPQLTTLAGQNTTDACVLEFDFIPKGDTVKFNYVFSSEEYVNSTCGPYNDVFAFYISGPNISGQQNMALVPGTNIPVTINSINSGMPGSNGDIANCTAMGPGSPFTQYYIDNALGETITHNGFTTVLRAIHDVVPCNTYHLRMAIADAGNALYDSGVFIEAGSLKANTPGIVATSSAAGMVAGTPFFVKGCSTGSFIISRPQATALPQTIKYNIGGTAINGTDYTAIADSIIIPANALSQQLSINPLTVAPSPQTITLYIKSPFICDVNNQVVDSATLLMYDSMRMQIATPDTTICRNQQVNISVDAAGPYTFTWSPDSSLSNNTEQNPIVSPQATTAYLVTASWPGSGCIDLTDSILVTVLPVPVINAGSNIHACLDLDLKLNVSVTPGDPSYTYLWSGPNSFSSTFQSPVIPNATEQMSGLYSVAVGLSNGCPAQRDTVNVTVVPPPTVPKLPAPFQFCRATVLDHRNDLGSNLLWYSDATDTNATHYIPLNDSTPEGFYTFYVSQLVEGCEGPRIKEDVSVKRCCEDNIFVPDAFTPNGDGKNDYFRVSKGDDHTVTELRIYDRWGKTVFESFNTNAPWDGTYNGQPLELGAYFYYMVIHCRIGTEIDKKGTIMLIR